MSDATIAKLLKERAAALEVVANLDRRIAALLEKPREDPAARLARLEERRAKLAERRRPRTQEEIDAIPKTTREYVRRILGHLGDGPIGSPYPLTDEERAQVDAQERKWLLTQRAHSRPFRELEADKSARAAAAAPKKKRRAWPKG